MPEVRLWWGPLCDGLIVRELTGVRYTNQVDGRKRRHPYVEGLFVPCSVPKQLKDLLTNVHEIDKAIATEIDHIFKENGMPLIMDQEMLKHSWEAWLHVIIKDNTSNYEGFVERKAVLTWENLAS
jgi:hypothetical protein